MTMAYKFKCLNCKMETQMLEVKIFFNEGCPNCNSKRIKLIGYSKEEVK